MSYRIVTDTCCDLPNEMYGQLDLACVSLSVNYQGQSVNQYTEQ